MNEYYQALEIFQGEDEQWYWRLKAQNGRILATGGEGYVSRANAHRGYVAASVLLVELANRHFLAAGETYAKGLEAEDL